MEEDKRPRFGKVLGDLLKHIARNASFFSSDKFATGEIGFWRDERLYGLVQCTEDISGDDCQGCLDSAFGDLKACCSLQRGGMVVSRNCIVRFEMYSFFNHTSYNSLLTYDASKGITALWLWICMFKLENQALF